MSEEFPHRVQNGDGSATWISCQDFDSYVASSSWYARALAAEKEVDRLAALHLERTKTTDRDLRDLIAERDAAEKRAEEAEGEVERLRTDLMVASQELDAAGCQVAASDAHRATFGETK